MKTRVPESPDPAPTIRPDLSWYIGLSRRRNVPPRCPFANVHRCPRYYSSLWLIGEHGGATQIEPDLDKVLLKKWEESELWPTTREQEPGVFGRPDNFSFSNMCPETIHDRFGWFASGLYPYTDEIDLEYAHARLARYGDNGEKWRWVWWMLHPMHYTECPLYSQLQQRIIAQPGNSSNSGGEERIVDARPSFWGVTLNLNALAARVRKWWQRKRGTNPTTGS